MCQRRKLPRTILHTVLIISGLLKLWFLNPIKINLHFETDPTVVLNAEQEYSAFKEILLIHKFSYLAISPEFKENCAHSQNSSTFQSLPSHPLRTKPQLWHMEQLFRTAPLYFIPRCQGQWSHHQVWPCLAAAGGAPCLLGTQGSPLARVGGTLRRSAGVQQFQR